MLKLDTFFIGALVSAIDGVRSDIAEGTRPLGAEGGANRVNSSEVVAEAMEGIDTDSMKPDVKGKMKPLGDKSFLKGLA